MALLNVLFMAVTSCASAELIAVSSILTFDVFKTYVKPAATPEQLITVAHVMIGVWGLVMAIVASIWNVIGIDLGWLFLVMGLLIGGAVFPTAFSITWEKQTRAGALSGAIIGLCAGLIAWLVTAHQYYGTISVSTTGMEYPNFSRKSCCNFDRTCTHRSRLAGQAQAFQLGHHPPDQRSIPNINA